ILTTLTDDIFSFNDSIINRFCTNILPQIHHNVKCLILDSLSMERILGVANYPNLTQLKLYNFSDKIVSSYFTVETPLRYIFQQQITDLILEFENDFNDISIKNFTADTYEYILKFFENLKHLSIIGSFPRFFPPLILNNLPSTTFFSSILNKLSIHVMTFNDCLALLDGRLQQLTSLIIVIDNMQYHSSNVYHIDDLPNLKCFSLTIYDCLTDAYDSQILPLFRRLLNLEELCLCIAIKNRTTLIDGNHVSDEILIHMPRLRTFKFCISMNIRMNNLVHYLSKNDIQRSFINMKQHQQVDCIVNYRYGIGTYHVFSLPFMFDCLEYVGNKFPSIVFNHVIRLTVRDEVSFGHEFFHRIAWSFPFLKYLCVMNNKPQLSKLEKLNSNCKPSYSIVKYPYLISLRLDTAYVHYIDQFLNQTKTHLPSLTILRVRYESLRIATRNFRKSITRLNCSKVKELIFSPAIIDSPITKTKRSKKFNIYFPLLESCVCSLSYE
ncbi:unnamed protein product, partial [Rotaria sp. Silwood1]